MKRKGVRAVIFDVGGVLSLANYSKKGIDGHHLLGIHNFMADSFNIDLDTWFDAIDTSYSEAIEGKISRSRCLKTIAKNLNCSVDKLTRTFISAYQKYFKKNEKLYEVAFLLKKKGYRIGILSDQWYLSKEALILKKDVKEFNPVIVSCDVGMRKPDPKIYKLLIRKTKLPAESLLFIDNREWNLINARKLGIKTILFENNEQLLKSLIHKGIL